jgi:hypothetical protein
VDHGAFTGLRWHELDADTRLDLLALRYADHLDVRARVDPEAERRAIREQFARDAQRQAAQRAMTDNGSTPEGIAIMMRDLGL